MERIPIVLVVAEFYLRISQVFELSHFQGYWWAPIPFDFALYRSQFFINNFDIVHTVKYTYGEEPY